MEKLTKQKLLHNLCGFTLTITKLKIYQFKDNYFIYLFISFLLRDLKKKCCFECYEESEHMNSKYKENNCSKKLRRKMCNRLSNAYM